MDISNLKHRLQNNRLAKDSFWAIFGNVLSKGLSLLAGIIVARFLGKEIYGEYGMIKNTIISISIFSTFGLAFTATKYVAENKNKNKGVLDIIIQYSRNVTLIISGIMALLLFVGADYIAEITLKAPHLGMPLRLVAVWIVFNAVTYTQVGILSGFNVFREMTRINFYIGVVTLLLSILFVYFWQLTGGLLALLFAQILNCYLNYQLINKVKPKYDTVADVDIHSVKLLKKELLKYSFPVALQEGVYSISSWLVSWILILFSGYNELGMYSAALQWSTIVLFIPGILRNVLLSHFAETADNKVRFDKILRMTIGVNLVSVLIPCFVIFILSDFISSFYGNTFNGLSHVINLAILAVIPMSLTNVYIQAFLSKGKNWLVFVLKAITFALTLVLSYIFIQMELTSSGAVSVCVASLISNIIYLILLMLFYNRMNNNKEKKNDLFL